MHPWVTIDYYSFDFVWRTKFILHDRLTFVTAMIALAVHYRFTVHTAQLNEAVHAVHVKYSKIMLFCIVSTAVISLMQ